MGLTPENRAAVLAQLLEEAVLVGGVDALGEVAVAGRLYDAVDLPLDRHLVGAVAPPDGLVPGNAPVHDQQ